MKLTSKEQGGFCMGNKRQQDKDHDMKADLEIIEQKYKTYYNQVLVKEQPFYHRGMTDEEVTREQNYLNGNLKAFYEGRYMPLWKQIWFK